MKYSLFTLATVLLASSMTVASCCSTPDSIDVIPYPNSVAIQAGSFNAAGAAFYCDPEISPEAESVIGEFFGKLSMVSGKESIASEKPGNGFTFLQDSSLGKEEYRLDVKKSRVIVKASSANGFRYAVQTLKQMLPADIFGNAPAPDADWTIQCASISDAPRFAYRGLHLDVSRHFFDTEEVKKYIDIMEVHKMNILHWHLTDDQGWRIEIKRYPRLTEVGSIRKGTVVKKDWSRYDGIPYGGYYTQEEIKDVVRYAD
ncbi:MAG: beta-N-acetylhexosaminidase, partial [Bacteroidales bacterium]|nr:beta-N-acetylhexosaminidase [Bacteroidales bacterium]